MINKITSLITAGGTKTYKISPKEGYGDVIKLSQDFPFLNLYKCAYCGGNLVFELTVGGNPDEHNFLTSIVCENCKRKA